MFSRKFKLMDQSTVVENLGKKLNISILKVLYAKAEQCSLDRSPVDSKAKSSSFQPSTSFFDKGKPSFAYLHCQLPPLNISNYK